MFSKFSYDSIPLNKIDLDPQNPRIVVQVPLKSEQEIINFLFEHESLVDLISRIKKEGKNKGAERPYVVRHKDRYIVVEGNNRIAAYKLLTGQAEAPSKFKKSVPSLTDAEQHDLSLVDCAIAPDRDSMFPILARSHFGTGDKSKWTYLGSRKTVYDEFKGGKTTKSLATIFDKTQTEIQKYILEYELYLEALKLEWTPEDLKVLHNPRLEFNPPVRFLETKGHKSKIGLDYDLKKLSVRFNGEAKQKFRHLILKLVIDKTRTKGHQNKLSATSTYEDVFSGYCSSSGSAESMEQRIPARDRDPAARPHTSAQSSDAPCSETSGTSKKAVPKKAKQPNLDLNVRKSKSDKFLFNYQTTITSGLVQQLMREAAGLDISKYPASATFLLRNILEALLRHKIHADAPSRPLPSSLEECLRSCSSNACVLDKSEKKILKEFFDSHLSYVNLGAHAQVIPSSERVKTARVGVAAFISWFCGEDLHQRSRFIDIRVLAIDIKRNRSILFAH